LGSWGDQKTIAFHGISVTKVWAAQRWSLPTWPTAQQGRLGEWLHLGCAEAPEDDPSGPASFT